MEGSYGESVIELSLVVQNQVNLFIRTPAKP